MKESNLRIRIIFKAVARVFHFLVELFIIACLLFLTSTRDWYTVKKLGGGYLLIDESYDVDPMVVSLNYRPPLIRNLHFTNTPVDRWHVLDSIAEIYYNKHFILVQTEDSYWLVDKSKPFIREKNDSLRSLGIYATPVTGPLDSVSYYHLKDSLLGNSKHWKKEDLPYNR